MMFATDTEKKLQAEYPGLLAFIGQSSKADDIASFFPAAFSWLRELGVDKDTGLDTGVLACFCALWRKNRVIYHIDEALGRELCDQAQRLELGDQLPGELLKNLPYPCISVEGPPIRMRYGETPVLDYTGRMFITVSDLAGLGIHGNCMAVLMEAPNGSTHMYYLPIIGTVGACVDSLRETLLHDFPDIPQERVLLDAYISIYAAQIILYLQAVNVDIERKPAPAKPKSRKRTAILQPKPPKEYHVGYHVGAALRKAYTYSGQSTGTGSAKRPHSRRGHWHNFWHGSEKDGTRHLELKWVAPTIIHGDQKDELPTVVNVKVAE